MTNDIPKSCILFYTLAVTASTACERPPEACTEPSMAESPSVAAATAQPAAPRAVTLELAFVTHLDANLPEQDVFIEREPGSGEVYRVTKGDHDMRAPLYATARAVRHDPFDPAAVGPYPRGKALGMSLRTWLAQKGGGSYSCENGTGKLDLSFSGLVPNGVYTMWHVFIALPATEPFSGTLDLPLGARDGSESKFTADADGAARFRRTFAPCLELSDDWTTSMLAISYHSDGKTYKADPGEFGSKSHVPLFVMLPRVEEARDGRVAGR